MRSDPPRSPIPSDELFARYLSGECTPLERERIETWASRDPSRTRMLQQMARAWEEAATIRGVRSAGALWSDLSVRLHSQRTPPPRLTTLHLPQPARHLMHGLAALLVLAVGALLLWPAADDGTPPAIAAASRDSSTFSTRRGQQATITLADGSRVTLDVDSRLSVAPGFGKGSRSVSLEGEAFFEVAHDPDAPFMVHTGSSVTQVVGTAFVVRRYAGETETRVGVKRGRVTIGGATKRALLDAGDVGRIGADGSTSARHDPGAVASLMAWKDGWLTLPGVSLARAAEAISRRYDIEVRVEDPRLRERHVNASFHDEAPAAVLQAIADAVDARVEWNGRTATLYSR